MDALLLSRLQFAITIFYHFLFVPLTIGLVVICAFIEIKYARTKNPLYKQMGDFWGKLFITNMVLGIVTGIAMEFQFGTNWSEYSKYMGDIFGSPLAIEALVAFFLESTFIGIWIFGRNKFSPKIRALSMVLVAVGTNLSALWIITANGFMQNPVGYKLADGKLIMDNFWAVVTNEYAWRMLIHTVIGCYIVGSFFVLGVSAYHLLRKRNVAFFKKSFKYGLVLAIFSTVLTPIIGHFNGTYTAKTQPIKAAAMEATWDTEKGLGFSIIQIPNEKSEKNFELLTIPKLGSFFYTEDFNGEVKGLKEVAKEDRPPVSLVYYSFRIMVVLGLLFVALSLVGLYFYRKDKLTDSKSRWYLKFMIWAIFLPYIAINAGWMVTEVGRQPWTVYGLMKTADAVSPIASSQVWFSLICLAAFYGVLLVANVYLIVKFAKRGPEEVVAIGGADHAA